MTCVCKHLLGTRPKRHLTVVMHQAREVGPMRLGLPKRRPSLAPLLLSLAAEATPSAGDPQLVNTHYCHNTIPSDGPVPSRSEPDM